MLSNAYFLAKIRFDTAENEPAKNLQNLNFANFLNFANPNSQRFSGSAARSRTAQLPRGAEAVIPQGFLPKLLLHGPLVLRQPGA